MPPKLVRLSKTLLDDADALRHARSQVPMPSDPLDAHEGFVDPEVAARFAFCGAAVPVFELADSQRALRLPEMGVVRYASREVSASLKLYPGLQVVYGSIPREAVEHNPVPHRAELEGKAAGALATPPALANP